MKAKRALFIIGTLALSIASCRNTSIVECRRVIQSEPGKKVNLSMGSTLPNCFKDSISYTDIQIVGDSILVLQKQTDDNHLYYFTAYSIPKLEFIGDFSRKGRGPGELLSPHIIRTSTDYNYLVLSDIAAGVNYEIDVTKSAISHETSITKKSIRQSNAVDWIPLSESQHLTLETTSDGKFRLIGNSPWEIC